MVIKWIILFTVTTLMIHFLEEPIIYEEVKKGEKKKIQEQTFTVELEETKAIFEKIINDEKDKKSFRFVGELIKDKEGQYRYCLVSLYRKKKDLLSYSFEEIADDFSSVCCLGAFEPSKDKTIMGENVDDSLSIPLFIKRVIETDNFYCILQAKDYSFVPGKKGILKSIKINVELTNSYSGKRTTYSEWKRTYKPYSK